MTYEGEIETRSATVADISFPKRIIELIVMPYEQAAEVMYRGRWIEEICTRGAYGEGLAHRGNVKVNVDHDVSRPIGKAVALHPSREDGLVAELRIARGDEGDHALNQAEAGAWDASAGFGLLADPATRKPYPDSETWESRVRRRLNRLWLDHVALVSQPAYVGANVLAVRSNHAPAQAPTERTATPNLDEVKALLAADRYARL